MAISEERIEVFEGSKIFYQFENRVPNILNYERTDVCPFERLTASFLNPKEAYAKLKSFVNSTVRTSEG